MENKIAVIGHSGTGEVTFSSFAEVLLTNQQKEIAILKKEVDSIQKMNEEANSYEITNERLLCNETILSGKERRRLRRKKKRR